MPSLLDIGKLNRVTTIRGVDVEVTGLSGAVFLHLLDDFPELRKVMAAGGSVQPDPATLISQVPGAVAAAIAAGCGAPGDKEAEKIAASLSIGEQTEVLLIIWDLTFPKGVASFIEALEKLGKEVVGPGRGPATRSPGQSNNASVTATHQKQPGATPPAN